jgi:hypothetical protein
MDLRAGVIDLAEGVTVRPALREEQFLAEASLLVLEPYVINGPHRSYTCPVVELASGRFLPAVFFLDGRLVQLILWLENGARRDWGSWTKEQMLAENRDNRAWLARALRRRFALRRGVYRLPWGSVSAAYDDKSASSRVTLRYA